MAVEHLNLQSLDLFEDFTTGELEKVSRLLRAQKVTEGEELFRRGSVAHTFFIIMGGNFMLAFEKDRSITLHNKGDIMGWSTVVPPHRYKGTAVALTESEVLVMPGEEFLHLIQTDNALGAKIMKKIDRVVKVRMPLFTLPDKQ